MLVRVGCATARQQTAPPPQPTGPHLPSQGLEPSNMCFTFMLPVHLGLLGPLLLFILTQFPGSGASTPVANTGHRNKVGRTQQAS